MPGNFSLFLQILIQNQFRQSSLPPQEYFFPQPTKIQSLARVDSISQNSFLNHDNEFSDGCDLNIFEEDTCGQNSVRVSGEQRKIEKRNSIRCPRWLWPDRSVPYKLAVKDPSIIEKFFRAVDDLNSLGCVNFYQLVDDKEIDKSAKMRKKYLIVQEIKQAPGRTCQASLGATGRRPHLDLSRPCTNGQILHELMHILGFAHEHQRPDRDRYVKIQCQHLMPNMTQDFRRLRSEVTTRDIIVDQYDFRSIMHYRLDHFSVDGKRTMELVDPQYLKAMGVREDEIGQMRGLSMSDVRRIRMLYQC